MKEDSKITNIEKSRILKSSLENEFSSSSDALLQKFLSKIKKPEVRLIVSNDSILREYARRRLHIKQHTQNTQTEFSNHIYLLVNLLVRMREMDPAVTSFADVMDFFICQSITHILTTYLDTRALNHIFVFM